MLITIIIFFIAITSTLLMVMFRAWEIKTSRFETSPNRRNIFPEIYFRHIEKIMLYLTKHIIQWVVLILVKYWFIIYTKTKKWTCNNLPKIHKFFKKRTGEITEQKNSFIRRAVLESRIKIRNIKEKVRKDHA
jgi:hypothetical protein